MTENFFQPFLSHKEPKVPEGWGLDAVRGEKLGECNGCGEPILFRDQYLYQYGKPGTILIHNRLSCWDAYHENHNQIKWEQEQERKREQNS